MIRQGFVKALLLMLALNACQLPPSPQELRQQQREAALQHMRYLRAQREANRRADRESRLAAAREAARQREGDRRSAERVTQEIVKRAETESAARQREEDARADMTMKKAEQMVATPSQQSVASVPVPPSVDPVSRPVFVRVRRDDTIGCRDAAALTTLQQLLDRVEPPDPGWERRIKDLGCAKVASDLNWRIADLIGSVAMTQLQEEGFPLRPVLFFRVQDLVTAEGQPFRPNERPAPIRN